MGRYTDSAMTASMTDGSYEFVILCVETAGEWWNDIWGNSTVINNAGSNYLFTVDGSDLTVSVDCAGALDGDAVVDECGVCGGDGIADGACDCAGNVDLGCGCGEAAAAENLIAMAIVADVDCAGVCGGTAEVDLCGECGGGVPSWYAAMVQMNMEMQLALQTVLMAQMRVLIVVMRDTPLTAIALH